MDNYTKPLAPIREVLDSNGKFDCESEADGEHDAIQAIRKKQKLTEDDTSSSFAIPSDGGPKDCDGVRMGVGYLLNNRGKQSENAPAGQPISKIRLEEGENKHPSINQKPSPPVPGDERVPRRQELNLFRSHQTQSERGKKGDYLANDKENDRELSNREIGPGFSVAIEQSPSRNQSLSNLETLQPHSPRDSLRSSPQYRPALRDPLFTPAFTTSPATAMMGLLDPIEPMFIPDGGVSTLVGIPGENLASPVPIEQLNLIAPSGGEESLPLAVRPNPLHPSSISDMANRVNSMEGEKNRGDSAADPHSDSIYAQKPEEFAILSEKEKSPSTLTPRTIMNGQGISNMHGYDFSSTGFDTLGYGSIIGFQPPDILPPASSSPPTVSNTNGANGNDPSANMATCPPFWSGNMALGNSGQSLNTPVSNTSHAVPSHVNTANFSAASSHLNAAIQQQLAHLSSLSAAATTPYPGPSTYSTELSSSLNALGNMQLGSGYNLHTNDVVPIQKAARTQSSLYTKPTSLPVGQKGAVTKSPSIGRTPSARSRRHHNSKGTDSLSNSGINASTGAPIGMAARLLILNGRSANAKSVGALSTSISQAAASASNSRAGSSGKKVFPCGQCGFIFGMRSNLKRHISTVHEDQRGFRCEVCPASFGLKQNLVTHVRVKHERRRPFSCETCGQKFGYKQVLQNHIRNIHADL